MRRKIRRQRIEEEKEEAKVQLPDLKASQYETDEITTGIDVSEFQGNIDWKAVADSGIDFAMIRVGYRGMKNGEIKEDACAKYNLQEASKNGLKIGAYFFSTAVTEEEAKEDENVIDLEAKPEITYDDFAKLQFQIGEIIACEAVPKSKKLLCSQVRWAAG